MKAAWFIYGVGFALAAGGAPPRGGEVAVPNGGFEAPVGQGNGGWTLAQPSLAAVSTTQGVQAPGGHSLRVENPPGGGETTVVSQPVQLRVGELYRLSAWIKARGVHADPLARYPTALGACVSMKSFPFTNASPTVAADGAERVSVLFLATASRDQVQLHLGRNGKATGTAWFDDVRLEKVEDIGALVPPETVRWAGRGFRYDEGGWICVHVEGEPYARGRQYGELVWAELARFVEKLANLQDKTDPVKGWNALRALADITLLRKYDPEYLEEMKGITDGAEQAGARFRGRSLDLLDIVTANSAIDLSEMDRASSVTATALTGRAFARADEDAPPVKGTDRCSSFIATKSATPDGRFLMGQLFMWPPGYTGVDWNVMVDVQPARGHRFVMQTFPGGISSGSDWYINDAGMVIGETTVAQTPFDPDGTPEANRSRKAAQYGGSIDQVAELLKTRNNGLYTNDWTIADTKTDEGAVFLLGTHRTRLWRTGSKGHPADTPGGLKDFVWADNNNRDLAVRAEMTPNADNHPVDLAFGPSNRDLAFWAFYREYGQARFDLAAGIRINASSPVNRPHACDGKLTTAEMAEKLMFIAHFGKTSTREKWVGSRFMADLPAATPHLTLGFTAFSPIFVADRLKAARVAALASAQGRAGAVPAVAKADLSGLKDGLAYPKALLWSNTVLPGGDGETWFVSGSAAYHSLLKRLPENPDKAQETLREALGELNARYGYLALKEGVLAPARARTAYDGYASYQIPRIKGTFLLHQLRLLLGNAVFARTLGKVHDTWQGRAMGTADFISTASAAAGQDLEPFVRQWVDRDDLPDPAVTATTTPAGTGQDVTVRLTQSGRPWHFLAAVELTTASGTRCERVEARDGRADFTFHSAEPVLKVRFDPCHDLLVPTGNPCTLANQTDDFAHLLLVHGTSRQVEGNRSLLLNYRDLLADAFTETLLPVKPDAEVTEAELRESDLVLFGGPEDNALLARLARGPAPLPVTFAPGSFTFQGRVHARPDDGLALAFPNPLNPRRIIYLYTANSRLELWHMTHAYQRGLPGWVLYREGESTARGFLGEPRFECSPASVPAR